MQRSETCFLRLLCHPPRGCEFATVEILLPQPSIADRQVGHHAETLLSEMTFGDVAIRASLWGADAGIKPIAV
jgi:hypothetical protein